MWFPMADGDRPTVLVVEDERPLLEVYGRWLEDSYEVLTAPSGSAALEQLDDRVAVALLDRRMPGMSGDEVLAEVRERVPDCKVAMVTAVEPDFDVIEMGFDAYLTKPVRRPELLNAVDRLLARTAFAELEREFYSLASRRAALESAKPEDELRDSEEYAELLDRIDRVRERIDETVADIDDDGFVAMVRDIEGQDSGEERLDDV